MTFTVEISDLVLEFGSGTKTVRALDGVNLDARQGEIIGIVGESGSGKSTAGFAIGRLMPEGVSPESGSVTALGEDMWSLSQDKLRSMRRNDIRYVFQDPLTTLDPTKRIGWQLKHAFEPKLSDEQVHAALAEVGLPDPERVAHSWPHELSGGMAQRAVIAHALIGSPKIIIADEATSALDASIRTRILEVLRDRARERGITLLLLSHDLRAMQMFCDRVAVMYGGQVVEFGPSKGLFAAPAHPYTKALLGATAGHEAYNERLETIPGIPPLLRGPSPGCPFDARCTHARAGLCDSTRPKTEYCEKDWAVMCHVWEELHHKKDAG